VLLTAYSLISSHTYNGDATLQSGAAGLLLRQINFTEHVLFLNI